MLTAIRERATGWIAWAIVILISIPFALWGINSYFEGGSETPVATVNGTEISVYAYQEELANQRQLLANQFGGSIDTALLDSLGIKEQVIQNLVDNRLLSLYADDRNYRISNAQLMDIIQDVPAFQEEGGFSQDLYQDVLAANRLTPQGFEESQRATAAMSQIQVGISETSFFTEVERDRILELLDQSRVVQFARISGELFADQINIDDAEIAQYYNDNVEQYQNPERIKVDYIELSIDSLSRSVEPSDEEISEHYEQTKGRYQMAETRKASHILIAVSASASEEERQEKLAKAADIAKRAQSGEDFAELAAALSDDPGSSINGGDLGVITRGQMAKPFEDAVYSMVEGEISNPVETQFGYHVVKLTTVDEGKQQPLNEVIDKVESDLRIVQAEELFSELAESFKNLVFESPEDIQVSANELGLEVMTSDWFTAQSGEGIAVEPMVRQAAFSEDVLGEGLVSQAIEIGFDKLIAVQKFEYESANAKPLESVKDDIETTLLTSKAREQAKMHGEALLEDIATSVRSKEDWISFTTDQELSVESLPAHRSDIPEELQDLGDAVYALSAPLPGEVRSGGLEVGNGDYVLYALESISPGNAELAEATERTMVEQQLMARDGADAYINFRSGLRDTSEILIHEDQL